MLVFYNEYKGIGGGEILIINILSFFYSRQNIIVKFICYLDSFIYKRLNELNIPFQFIDADKNNFRDDISNLDIVIMPHFNNMSKFKFCRSRFIYWEIFPTVLANTIFENKSIFKQWFVDYLEKNNSLYFMDKNSVSELILRGIKLKNVKYIPIPVKMPKSNEQSSLTCLTSPIFITYIGRDLNWKVYPIKKVIDDCGLLIQYNFEIIIFCDTNIIYNKIIKNLPPNINLTYYKNLYGPEMENLLLKYSQLHFSMGTSALDAAKYGIPTILLDYSYEEFPSDYKYNYIFNSKDYSLGSDVKNKISTNKEYEITDLLKSLFDPDVYKSIKAKTYNYVLDNHSIDTICTSILQGCNNSTTTIRDVYKWLFIGSILKNPFLYLINKRKEIFRMLKLI